MFKQGLKKLFRDTIESRDLTEALLVSKVAKIIVNGKRFLSMVSSLITVSVIVFLLILLACSSMGRT